MRWMGISVMCLMISFGSASRAMAQADPNQPNPLRDLIQQARQNMQNQGVTGQDIGNTLRQQVQDGTFNPQQFQQQLIDNGIINQDMINQFQNQVQNRTQQGRMSSLQQQLNATDEEWAVLAPKIQKVMDLSADLGRTAATGNNRLGGLGGRGQQLYQVSAVNPQNPQAQSQPAQGLVAKALAELQAVLADAASSDSQVVVKLKALRDAKEQVKTQLAAAEKDLLALVTLRQEGVLIMNVIVE
ncbi:MAG TPA: hypothetical protein VGN88_09340 [Phycisphaerae bacterium]